MKRTLTIMYMLLALFTLPSLAYSEDLLHFKESGFSIAPLEGKTDPTAYTPLKMLLPATDSFAPNVNVRIQPYNGTIKQYADLSKKQFIAAKLTVQSETVTQTSVVWEYSGTMQGHNLHWYAKAERGNGKVYLVTATAKESQWNDVAAKLKACVNSFKLK